MAHWHRYAFTLFVLLVGALAVAPTVAVAESSAGPDEAAPRLEAPEVVVVTASRLDVPLAENPAATSVVEGDDLLRAISKTINAEEATKLVPGVKVDNQADGERVHLSIRGQGILTERGISGIMVLLDGIPLNDPMGLAPDLFDVDWASVARVEVQRGPASSLYGASSAGGVVDIVTQDGGLRKVSGDALLTFGSHSFWKAFAEAGGSTENVNYRISASRMEGDGYRVHTAYDATNVYGKVRFDLGSRAHLTAILASTEYVNENAEGLSKSQAEDDPTQANPDAVSKNEFQNTRRTTLGLTGGISLTPSQDVSFSAYTRLASYDEWVPNSQIHRTYDNPGGQLQYVLRSGAGGLRNEFSAGTDVSWQSVDEQKNGNPLNPPPSALLPTSNTYDEKGLGVFALDRLRIGRDWAVTFGLRWDKFEGDSSNNLTLARVSLPDNDKVTERLGATWNPDPRYGLYVSWGQGYVPPSTEQLINNPDAFGGYNTHLSAATSSGADLGVRGELGKTVSYDVAVFRLDTDDDFNRYRVPGRNLETFYYNAGASRRYGLEASLAWQPLKVLTTRLSYTYSHFRYTEVTDPPLVPNPATYHGTWLPSSPEHMGYLDAEYRPTSHWIAGLSVEGQSRSYTDHTNAAWAWGYGLVHLRAGYTWSEKRCAGDVSLAVRNVFDREYIAFVEPDPDGNSYHPAAKREVFLGARVRFGG